jgi:hypothetical protein
MVRYLTIIKLINSIDIFFLDENSLLKKFKSTISTFCFSITAVSNISNAEIVKSIFRNIFKLFPNLTNLQFSRYSSTDILSLSFGDDIPMYSSTLSELHMNLAWSVDFLSLLDGRLSHLHTLYVEIQFFCRPSVYIDIKVNEKLMCLNN